MLILPLLLAACFQVSCETISKSDVIPVDCANGTLHSKCSTGASVTPRRAADIAIETASKLLRKVYTPKSDLSSSGNDHGCPTWFNPSGDLEDSRNCTCGSSLDKIVRCNQLTKIVGVMSCYSMTYDDSTGPVAGACPYGCVHRDGYKVKSPYYTVPSNENQLNNNTCGLWNRRGQLCGECQEGFAPAIYSHALYCIPCTESHWMKYIALAYIPATVFFIVLIVFRISATTPNMFAFITICQAFSAPVQMRIILAEIDLPTGLTNSAKYTSILARIIFSLYGVWNLDFLRPIIPAFCINKQMGTLQVMALDYIVAFYPLALLALCFVSVKLHSRGYRVIICIWKPFQRVLACFTLRQDNFRNSLVEVFATFILLSYNKIIGICSDLFMPTKVYNSSGHIHGSFLYYDATTPFFGRKHLTYAIPTIFIFLVFIILPLALLLFYPFKCFQRFLNHVKLQSFALRVFMDAFQGGYRDGTDGGRDCRFFAGVYFIVRVFMFLQYSLTASVYSCGIAAFIFVITVMMIAVVQPYKKTFHNTLDTILFTILALWYLSYAMIGLGFYQKPVYLKMAYAVFIALSVLPITGAVVAVFYIYCYKNNSVRNMCRRVFTRHSSTDNSDDMLPHRLEHPEHYEQSPFIETLNAQPRAYGTMRFGV